MTRVDAKSKADGSLQYTDDLEFDGLHADIIRSSVAYGEILAIHYDKDFDFSSFTIVDYQDIEAKNSNPILIDDQPFLSEKIVRFIGEPILLIAHTSKKALHELKKHISIEYKTKEPLFSMEDALNKKVVIFGEDNIYKSINISQGKEPNYEKFESLEKTYTTPHQEQLYLEPQSMIARYREGKIKIIGSMQCPFYVEESLQSLSGEKIEIEQAPTGGAFGGKEDYPSLMAAYVYLLAKKAKKDVKMVLSRSDDIAFTPKRHPSKIKIKSYFDKSAKLVALKINILIDGGAYATLTPVVLARVVLHICGFYDVPYMKIDAYGVATNTPPNGAFRGFGAPQAFFAIERHMDDIARSLNLLPKDVRAKNLPTQNTLSVSGVKIQEYKKVKEIFELACIKSDFEKKYKEKNAYKGIGMALFMHGGGFVGLGEEMLASKVWLKLYKDGRVEIKIASTEMGQGTMTVLPQIVAKELNIPPSLVNYHVVNTKEVANSGPTVSSRTVMVVGELLKKASKNLKSALGIYKNLDEYYHVVNEYLYLNKKSDFKVEYKKPSNIQWDEDKFYGNGYSAYSLGCYIAEVTIDPIDYRVKVTNFYAFHDVGEVVNPILAQGQVEGGVAQGVGFALFEKIKYQDGAIKNPHLSNYIIPMAADLQKIDIEFLNTHESSKGLGELPMDGVAPAIANAITDAIDSACDTLPITPEILEQKCR